MSTGQWVGAILGAVVGFLIGGWYGAIYGAILGYNIGGYIDPVKPDVKQPGAPAQQQLQVMTNQIGLPIYDVLGTAKVTGQLMFYGSEYSDAVYYRIAKGKYGISGWRYFASWALGICMGPVDALYTVFRDQDPIWSGELTRPESGGEATIQIEGVGTMVFYFGTDDQMPNTNAGTLRAGNIYTGDPLFDPTLNTGHRHLCWAFFDNCFMNEYNRMPSMSFIVKKIPPLFSEETSQIQTYDVNPAHALWFTLVQKAGLPEEWVHSGDFIEVAASLFLEYRGVSVLFDAYQSTQNYLEAINSHVDMILRFGSDGKFHPKLIRYVDPIDLPVIDESILLEEPTFSRKSWIDTINEVKVQYSQIIGERDSWKSGNPILSHSANDMASDGVYLYVCGSRFIGPVNPICSAAVSRIRITDGIVMQTLEYHPTASGNDWWNCCLIDGDFIYLGGSVNFGGGYNRAVLQKRNKSDFGLVWEYKYPAQSNVFQIQDVDHDSNYIYACATYNNGLVVGRIKVDKATGMEQWRFQNTYHSPYGMICDTDEVYILKHTGGFRVIETVQKSDGSSISYGESLLLGAYHRGFIDEGSLFLGGQRALSYGGVAGGSVQKVAIGPYTVTWTYEELGDGNIFKNCFKDSEGNIVAAGLTVNYTIPTIVKLGASGSLIWRQVGVADDTVYWALVEGVAEKGHFYIGMTKRADWSSVIERRSLSTGELD